MNRKLIYAVLGIQMAVLASLYAYHSAGLGYPTVRLRTVPVDPRDLLRGDYVRLRYEISQLPESAAKQKLPATVWVKLKPDGEFWVIDAVNLYQSNREANGQAPELRARLNGTELTYDLERFYVPEGTGNNPVPSGKLVVEVAVRRNGTALIKHVFDSSGHPWPK